MIVNKYAKGGGGSSSGVTPQDVQAQIDSALTPYWESGETKDYVDEAVSGISLDGYYTSAQTEAAISAATSGKADAANITKNTNKMYFPVWSSQGVITGITGSEFKLKPISLNGGDQDIIIGWNNRLIGFYAPQSAGTAGDILVSTGSGAPVWSAVTFGGDSSVLKAVADFPEDPETGDMVSKLDFANAWNTSDNITAKMHIDGDILDSLDWSHIYTIASFDTFEYNTETSGKTVDIVIEYDGTDWFLVPYVEGTALVAICDLGSDQVHHKMYEVEEEVYASVNFLEDDFSDKGGMMIQIGRCGYNQPTLWDGTYDQIPDIVLNSFGNKIADGTYIFDGDDWKKAGGNSNILAAISSQTEYEAISGSVKTGDLIQVWDVDINGDEENEIGLFSAYVDEQEDPQTGDITRTIEWERRDNGDSLIWDDINYPWMNDNDVYPVDLGGNSFLIASDGLAGDEAYYGIGFDGDGKPVFTHIVPEYEDDEVTGITREDRDILGELDTLDQVVSAALVDLNEKKVESQDIKHIVKLTQAEYDQLATKDPETFYIIITNNN